MAFIAFDVAADAVIVCAVFRADNLLLGSREVEKISHWTGPPACLSDLLGRPDS